MNKVVLIGRLVKDPDFRQNEVNENSSFCRFTVAVDRPWVRDRENQQTADFINCLCFGKTADFVNKWFRKGSPIVVDGRIQTGKYENREGQTVYTTDVNAERVEFVPKNDGNGEQSGNASTASRGARDASETRRQDTFRDIPAGVDEELPFS